MADIDYEKWSKEQINESLDKMKYTFLNNLGTAFEGTMGSYAIVLGAINKEPEMIIAGVPLVIHAAYNIYRNKELEKSGGKIRGLLQEAGILDKPEE